MLKTVYSYPVNVGCLGTELYMLKSDLMPIICIQAFQGGLFDNFFMIHIFLSNKLVRLLKPVFLVIRTDQQYVLTNSAAGTGKYL